MKWKLNEYRKNVYEKDFRNIVQNPAGSIALRLSLDASGYSIWYASDKLR